MEKEIGQSNRRFDRTLIRSPTTWILLIGGRVHRSFSLLGYQTVLPRQSQYHPFVVAYRQWR
jgi:hypothetical protein